MSQNLNKEEPIYEGLWTAESSISSKNLSSSITVSLLPPPRPPPPLQPYPRKLLENMETENNSSSSNYPMENNASSLLTIRQDQNNHPRQATQSLLMMMCPLMQQQQQQQEAVEEEHIDDFTDICCLSSTPKNTHDGDEEEDENESKQTFDYSLNSSIHSLKTNHSEDLDSIDDNLLSKSSTTDKSIENNAKIKKTTTPVTSSLLTTATTTTGGGGGRSTTTTTGTTATTNTTSVVMSIATATSLHLDKKDIVYEGTLIMFEQNKKNKTNKQKYRAILTKTELLIYRRDKTNLPKQIIPLTRVKQIHWFDEKDDEEVGVGGGGGEGGGGAGGGGNKKSSSKTKKKFRIKSKSHDIDFIFTHSDLQEATIWVQRIMLQIMFCDKLPPQLEEPSAIKKGFIKLENIGSSGGVGSGVTSIAGSVVNSVVNNTTNIVTGGGNNSNSNNNNNNSTTASSSSNNKNNYYFALYPGFLAYYLTESHFLADFPMNRIHVSQLAAVKCETNSKLTIPTLTKRFILQFSNDNERDDWRRALLEAHESFYTHIDVQTQQKIRTQVMNCYCADCGEEDPEWANIYLYVTLCKKCIGIHRSLAIFAGKTLSMQLDSTRWSEQTIQLMIDLGNGNSNAFWLGNYYLTQSNKKERNKRIGDEEDEEEEVKFLLPISSQTSSVERERHIIEKYIDKKFAKLISINKTNEMYFCQQMQQSIRENNLLQFVYLFFNGIKFDSCNAYEVALEMGNNEILEFINSHSGFSQQLIHFISPKAALVNENEIFLISFANDGIYLKRRSTLKRGILHLCLIDNNNSSVPSSSSTSSPSTSSTTTTTTTSSIVKEKESVFTYSQFLFVSHLSSLSDNSVKLNLSSPDIPIVTFRSCDNDNNSIENLQKWTLHLCQCFIPHPKWSELNDMEILCASCTFVCHTSFGDWCESWCLLFNNELHIISSIGNKLDIINIRSATNIRLESVEGFLSTANNQSNNNLPFMNLPTNMSTNSMSGSSLNISGSGGGGGGTSSSSSSTTTTTGNTPEILIITMPEETLYITTKVSVIIKKWYEIIKSHLFSNKHKLPGCNTLENHIIGKDQIPLIVDKTIRFLAMHIFHSGIYRLGGSIRRVEALCDALINQPMSVSWDKDEPRWTVEEVAGALKKFLRDLDDPPLQSDLESLWLMAMSRESLPERIQMYKELLKKLKPINYRTVRFLMIHLANIAQNSILNQMTADNLSIVLGPCLLRPGNAHGGDSSSSSQQQQQANDNSVQVKSYQIYAEIVRDLISHYILLFDITQNELKCEEQLIKALKSESSLNYDYVSATSAFGSPGLLSSSLSSSTTAINSSSTTAAASLSTKATTTTTAAASASSSSSGAAAAPPPGTLMVTVTLKTPLTIDLSSFLLPLLDDTTAESLLQYLVDHNRLSSTSNLAVFECLLNGEIERPLLPFERIKPLFSRANDLLKLAQLIVKVDHIANSLESISIANNWQFNLRQWEIHFSDKKTTYRKRYLSLASGEVNIFKNPNLTDLILQRHVTRLYIYYGAEKKRKPPHCYNVTIYELPYQDSNPQQAMESWILSFTSEDNFLGFWSAVTSQMVNAPPLSSQQQQQQKYTGPSASSAASTSSSSSLLSSRHHNNNQQPERASWFNFPRKTLSKFV